MIESTQPLERRRDEIDVQLTKIQAHIACQDRRNMKAMWNAEASKLCRERRDIETRINIIRTLNELVFLLLEGTRDGSIQLTDQRREDLARIITPYERNTS